MVIHSYQLGLSHFFKAFKHGESFNISIFFLCSTEEEHLISVAKETNSSNSEPTFNFTEAGRNISSTLNSTVSICKEGGTQPQGQLNRVAFGWISLKCNFLVDGNPDVDFKQMIIKISKTS